MGFGDARKKCGQAAMPTLKLRQAGEAESESAAPRLWRGSALRGRGKAIQQAKAQIVLDDEHIGLLKRHKPFLRASSESFLRWPLRTCFGYLEPALSQAACLASEGAAQKVAIRFIIEHRPYSAENVSLLIETKGMS